MIETTSKECERAMKEEALRGMKSRSNVIS